MLQIRLSDYAPCRAFAPCVLLSKPRDTGLAGVRRPGLVERSSSFLLFFRPVPISFHDYPPLTAQNSLREALEAHPGPQRTRLDYERVLDAYRAVYHGDPASPKADASVFAVAGLLAEEGRLFSDERLLHDAIGQYEFLRLQYPSTRYRFSALITEGEIYRHDIGDREAPRKVSAVPRPTRRIHSRNRRVAS